MEDAGQGSSTDEQVSRLRDFIKAQLEALDDPRNVHAVRERLYGERWLESAELEELPEDVDPTLEAEIDLAWRALTRYPWDLYGAQQALGSALERLST